MFCDWLGVCYRLLSDNITRTFSHTLKFPTISFSILAVRLSYYNSHAVVCVCMALYAFSSPLPASQHCILPCAQVCFLLYIYLLCLNCVTHLPATAYVCILMHFMLR